MSKKKKTKSTNTSQGQLLLHIPNPMHLQACIKGGRIFKDKSKYTRKQKHKASYDV